MDSATRPLERQRHARRIIHYPGEVRCGDACIDCEIVDLSAGGAKIRLLEAFECSSPITLSFDVGTFDGEVFWQNEELVGIKFKDDSGKVGEIIERYLFGAAHPGERRGDVRTLVIWATKVIFEDGEVNARQSAGGVAGRSTQTISSRISA